MKSTIITFLALFASAVAAPADAVAPRPPRYLDCPDSACNKYCYCTTVRLRPVCVVNDITNSSQCTKNCICENNM